MTLPDTSGIHDIKLETSTGVVETTVALPGEMPAGSPLSLVMVLHYAGQATSFYGRPLLEFLVAPSFAEQNTVLFAPTSLGGDWQHEQNVTAIFELIKIFEENYNLDENKRIVTGYSMGALGCWHLATQHPDFFSAIIPIAGFPLPLPRCTVPTHAILSDSDEIFQLEKFQQVVAGTHDPKLSYTIIEGAGHYDISAFGGALSDAVKNLDN